MTYVRRALGPCLLAFRRLRARRPIAAAVFLVVAATSFLFAAAPRAFNSTADEGLRFAVRQASPYERNVEIDQVTRIPPAADGRPLVEVEATGEQYEGRFAPSVREVTRAGREAVETVRFTVVDAPGEEGPPGTTRLLTMRFVSDAERHITIVAGRLPAADAPDVELPFRGDQRTAPLLEVALSREAAGQLSVGVGALLYLAPDSADTLVRDVPLSEHRFIAVRVTGLVDARSAADQPWLRDSRLGRAVTRDTDTRRYVYGYALFGADAYGDVLRAVDPFQLRYEWRYDVDASRFQAADFDRFEADVRRLDAEFGQTTYGQTAGAGVRTGLSEVLARFERNRDAAEAVLAIAAAALLAVALSVVGLLTALGGPERRETVGLVRSRGASMGQVVMAEVVQGLIVALPAGALGFLVASVAGGRGSVLSAWLVLAIVLATALVLGAAAVAPARRPPALRVREDVVAIGLSGRRVAIELLTVAVALVGVYLLRRRGLADEDGFDPYLAAVPVLLGLAGGMLAVRLHPVAVRAAALAAGRRRDLVPVLGFQHAAREPGTTASPLLVVLLSVSVAVFAAAMVATLSHAQSGVAGELSPLATGSVQGFRVAFGVAGAYAAVALVLTPVLTAAARLRDIAYLRALGLSRRQALGLTAVELGPPIAAAIVLGIVVGIVLVFVTEPGLDLAGLAGGEPVGVRIDPLAPVLLLFGLGLVLAGALAALGAAERRTSVARVLRIGER
jgi:putative ABC transport system permease protein